MLLSRVGLFVAALGWLDSIAASKESCDATAAAGAKTASPEDSLKEETRATRRQTDAGALDWMRVCGGVIHDQVQVMEGECVATQALQTKDVVLSLPYECMLVSDTYCDLMQKVETLEPGVWLLQDKGDDNNTNITAKSAGQRLPPHLWSTAGQTLLQQVHDFAGLVSLPSILQQQPVAPEVCSSNADESVSRIMTRYAQKLPNGKWGLVPSFLKTTDSTTTNTRLAIQKDVVQFVAVQPVPAGQAVSFHDVDEDWTVTDMVRELGTVPTLPQKWTFAWETDKKEDPISLVLEEYTGKHAKPGGDRMYRLTWMHEEHNDFPQWTHQALRILWKAQLTRLHAMDLTSTVIPSHELDVIQEYHQALVVVMESLNEIFDGGVAGWCEYPAVEDDDDDETLTSKKKKTEKKEPVQHCFVPQTRYSVLGSIFDDYHRQACDEQAEVNYIMDNFDRIDQLESPYQDINYIQEESSGNTCFELDNIYQICSSYRPHYHEMVVHYTARFLPDIRRVVWIGGGDAMLLHEILKYPNLERVIGLELDQQVTRMSFKHFGVQPHYDDPRVQWWYGDAAKSLLMLPAEYFGTFDMVLVDLSETVMSFLVTDGMDILTALSLLLKPEGIFVKNEMYFEKLKQIFPHAVQLKYDDVPLICKQCLALGSFATNFLETNQTDHPVETLFAPLEKLDTDWQEVHSYHWNPSAEQHCMSDNSYTTSKQDNSPGLVLILEAEDANPRILGSSKALETALVNALKKQVTGLHVITSLTPSDNDQAVVIMMQEGYIVARGWEEFEYCALDIHLWSAFNQLEAIEKALVAAVGSESSSSFRIVAGGMYGRPTWKDDVASRGPQFDPECGKDEEKDKVRELATKDVVPVDSKDLMNAVMEENLAMWIPKDGQEHTNPLVICGLELEPCQALDFVQTKSFPIVTPVWTCSGPMESEKDMFACETQVVSILKEAAAQEIRFIVMDASTPLAMVQVVHKIVSSKLNRKAFFSTKQDTLVVMVAGSDPKNQPWRHNFVSQFASFFPYEPGFFAQVMFEDKHELDLFVLGDKYFTRHLDQVNEQIQTRTGGIEGITSHVGGVEFKYYDDFEATRYFEHEDYDQNAPLEQFESQQPVGYQTIFQMQTGKNATLSKELIGQMLETALDSTEVERTLEPHLFANLGDGSVIVAGFNSNVVLGGIVICTWDGRDHLDLNLFTYDESEEFANEFSEAFTAQNMNVVLRDEMPRGYGRVVNFASDLEEPRQQPYWAKHLE